MRTTPSAAGSFFGGMWLGMMALLVRTMVFGTQVTPFNFVAFTLGGWFVLLILSAFYGGDEWSEDR